MKKFKFRLEPLLRLKEHNEKEKQKTFGLAAHKVARQEDVLHQLSRDRVETQLGQRGHLSGRIDTGRLLIYSRYLGKLKKNELTGREILKAFITDRERKRDELIEATKQKKIFEKLKERRRLAFLHGVEMLTQKEQDDIAAKLFLAKKSSRG